MASEVSSVNLWLIIGISVVFLFGTISVLICCAWCIKIRKNPQNYTVEDVGFKPRGSSFSFYRKFCPGESGNANLLQDDSASLDVNLSDSMDASNRFTNSLLRLNSQTDEMRSCISTESLGTFYSTYFSRDGSRRSFVSCSEESRDGDGV